MKWPWGCNVQVNELAGAIFSSHSNNQSNDWVSRVWARNGSRVCAKTLLHIVQRLHLNFTVFSWIQNRQTESKFRKHQKVMNHSKSFRRKNVKKSFGSGRKLSVRRNPHKHAANKLKTSRVQNFAKRNNAWCFPSEKKHKMSKWGEKSEHQITGEGNKCKESHVAARRSQVFSPFNA